MRLQKIYVSNSTIQVCPALCAEEAVRAYAGLHMMGKAHEQSCGS
jgi:hypothetical protein